MPRPESQFTATVRFTFQEHGDDRRRKFVFPENGHRRVPMQIEGVDGLNTVAMWRSGEATFYEGDETDVECVVLWTEAIYHAVIPGAKFELWDGGFFAEGTVLEKREQGWPKDRIPPAIEGTRIVAWQRLEGCSNTGACAHFINGESVSGQQWIAVAQYDEGPGYALFTGSENFMTDTLHDSFVEALEQAASEWTGLQANWVPVHASLEERGAIAKHAGGTKSG